MKNKIPLSDFCKDHSQKFAAEVLKVTEGAVSQMLARKREIYIYADSEGWKAFEVKPVGKNRAA